MARDLGKAWWRGTYLVQRECTCARHQRGAECSDGWHTVDSHDDLEGARADVSEMRANGYAYRVALWSTGEVVP